MAITFGLLILYFIVVSGFPGTAARFRIPIMPLMSIGAGVTIARWRAKRRAQILYSLKTHRVFSGQRKLGFNLLDKSLPAHRLLGYTQSDPLSIVEGMYGVPERM